jgi:CTP synthase (UTP-ammonia lyase)
MLQIAIVADYDPANLTHLATQEALAHSAAWAGIQVQCRWLATDQLGEGNVVDVLRGYEGILIGPASPYRSKQAALDAIRFARQNGIPLIGTCGGFQHIILEWARNVVGFEDAEHAEYDPYASRLFLTRLPCSLIGKTMRIELPGGSVTSKAYGKPHTDEQYYCNFGLNDAYRSILESSGLGISGIEAGDEESRGAVRIVEMPNHPFFVGTLFVPQVSSREDLPHPLITAFVRAVSATRSRR